MLHQVKLPYRNYFKNELRFLIKYFPTSYNGDKYIFRNNKYHVDLDYENITSYMVLKI